MTELNPNNKDLEQDILFQDLVSRISAKFIGLTGNDFEQAIQKALSEIGRYFNSDTVRLYRLSLQGDVLKIRNTWRTEKLSPPDEMPEIHKLKYPNLAAHYSQGESVLFSNYEESPSWPEMRKILKFFGTKAGVGVPLEIDVSGVDIFAMDKVLSEYEWPKDIIEKSKAIGKVMLSALRRREVEVELQKSYDEIKKLKDQLEKENIYLREEIKDQHNFDFIIGQSPSLNYVLHRVEQVGPTDATVLIEGETGTGKELFAHAIYGVSLRKHNPLIKVGCATLSSSLIESELFGHEKGAFTGADKQRVGRFELANHGTIFLDEIGELSLELQAKLLRVLQEGEFERLGSSKTIKIDVRVITATNRSLEEEVKKGNFRKDLYYRLTSFVITIPPLRDRQDDIPLLFKFLVNKFGKKFGKEIRSIPRSSMKNLVKYSWPGNIRELENVIENAIIISDNGILNVKIPGYSSLSENSNLKLEDIERDHIIQVLESTNWRLGGKGGAAELLGMKRTTLYAKMKKHKISRQL
jgi:transcriptional regulator with GAF, ATPase, and Fis domain